MLRKLLKYEFAATGRYLLPLLCLLLVMAAEGLVQEVEPRAAAHDQRKLDLLPCAL